MAIRTSKNTITILDVCAGTGMLGVGVKIALDSVGLDGATVGYIEREASAAASIVARMDSTTLRKAPVWSDVKSIDANLWRGCVDIFVAGYPCQPFSSSGKRRGESDPRHIWPDVLRAIAGIEPGIVFLENVSGHVSKGAGPVICDLQELGYRVTAGLFSSAETGASQRRERLFILGNANLQARWSGQERQAKGRRRRKPKRTSRDLPRYAPPRDLDLDATAKALSRAASSREAGEVAVNAAGVARQIYRDWTTVASLDPARMPAIESEVRGMASGLVSRSDRLRLTGNGVDPLVAAYAFVTLSACLDG